MRPNDNMHREQQVTQGVCIQSKQVLACTCVLYMLASLLACAIPKDQSSFSVRAPGGSPNEVFLSSSELMVAGLVSESLTLGAKGKLFEAESRLRRAYALAPGNPAIAFNLAVVLGQQGYAEEALALLGELRSKQGDIPRLMTATADVYSSKGDFSRAREALKVAFNAYQTARNFPQAALIARSISNLAFADGNEQEGLCYSYEALGLAPNAQQLGAHASIMVGMNLYKATESFVSEQITQDISRGVSSQVHSAVSLAKGAQGDLPGALKEIEVALDLVADNPDLSTETRVLWWLLKREVPTEKTDQRAIDADVDLLRNIDPEVQGLQEHPTYQMVRWPPIFRELLDKAKIES